MQELAQRLQRLALKDTTEHKISEERKIALTTGLIPSIPTISPVRQSLMITAGKGLRCVFAFIKHQHLSHSLFDY